MTNMLLKPGMLVRAPTPSERSEYEDDFRAHRLGSVVAIDELLEEVTIQFWQFELNQPDMEQIDIVPTRFVARCRVLPETQVLFKSSQERVLILEATASEFAPGEVLEYFVMMRDGSIQRISECDLMPPAHRQDVDPLDQLRSYELNNPAYIYHRNRFVSVYADLLNVTVGLDALVNTRVLLLAHQAEVITRVLSDSVCRYILADEVGLGKTIEACVILKGLRDRYGDLPTLIVVPSALEHQWYQELDRKFWLRFEQWQGGMPISPGPNWLLTHDALENDPQLWQFIQSIQWGVLIVDEAHHIPRRQSLFNRVQHLSRSIERVLLLSATPVQHRRIEYLNLLRLLHPQRYDLLSMAVFEQIIANQKTLYGVIQTIQGSLNPDYYDSEEFLDLVAPAVPILAHDVYVQRQLEAITETKEMHQALRLSRQLIAYIAENYRIESRVIRNRRASIDPDLLPERSLDDRYAYNPTEAEKDAYNELMLYVQQVISSGETANVAFCRALIHAAASSPEALIYLLEMRHFALESGSFVSNMQSSNDIAYMRSPREESKRLQILSSTMPSVHDENRLLNNARQRAQQWQEDAQEHYEITRFINGQPIEGSHRLEQVLRAVKSILLADAQNKIVIFTGWPQTFDLLHRLLQRHFGSRAVATFHVGVEQESDLEIAADLFQSDPECRVMLCDELGGEGRNFQIAAAIIHVDLPWSPARIEQRIGRIDRLGRSGVVKSIVPFAHDHIEEDLLRLFQDSFQVFTRSMSGLEIIVEDVQSLIDQAFQEDNFEGLRRLLPKLRDFSEEMRHEIELERVYEETAINIQVRQEIAEISDEYTDGEALRTSVSEWANYIGLRNHFNPRTGIVTYEPRRFSLKAMENAKLMQIPNMEDANQRSGRPRDLVIRGTFNRSIAVHREDLVFFAPSEPWTRTTIENALESERGRCAASEILSQEVEESWEGFDFFFTLQVNPRPLYELGLAPIHLHRARGMLNEAVERIIVDLSGNILPYSSPIRRLIIKQNLRQNMHLGRRGNGNLDAFKLRFPTDEWQSLVDEIAAVAWAQVTEKFRLEDEADELRERLEEQRHANQAVHLWLESQGIKTDSTNQAKEECIAEALIAGVLHPLIRLESISFWKVAPEHDA